jgi:hypothetical protein
VPAGDYVVAAQAVSALVDRQAVQAAVTAVAGQTTHVPLAFQPAPRALEVIARPIDSGAVVVFPGDRAPGDMPALVAALRVARSVSMVEVGTLPRPPGELGLDIGDGYAELARPAAGSLVACIAPEATLGVGAPIVLLRSTVRPHCEVFADGDRLIVRTRAK